ncbi:sigma factor-like helix-turn-helix DNA-binding protein [Fictibacillus iocasae]|uniref:Sigma factor-like helix-turn-helix DNA-binding protein n=1 Tax=Fictibacillus iocasae TaxID=2715437 RepID=A0ABW2NKL5_9BACL
MKKDRKKIIEMMSVDFHRFLTKEQSATAAELAEEFGLSLQHVRQLRRKISRKNLG